MVQLLIKRLLFVKCTQFLEPFVTSTWLFIYSLCSSIIPHFSLFFSEHFHFACKTVPFSKSEKNSNREWSCDQQALYDMSYFYSLFNGFSVSFISFFLFISLFFPFKYSDTKIVCSCSFNLDLSTVNSSLLQCFFLHEWCFFLQIYFSNSL